jgi:RecB family exonuclease
MARSEVAGAAAGVAIDETSGRSVSSYTLEAQANCPFQAYGRYRLGAQAWPEVRPGLDPRERGNLVHEALRCFWDAVCDSETLRSLDQETALPQAIARAVAKALAVLPEERWRMMPEFVHAAEAQCLHQLLKAWLALESQRPPFTVLAREDRLGLELAGLTLALRPDRLDQTADGRRLIIDYKTGRGTRVAGWLERPLSAVQLPLYALAETQHEIAGVMVARVRAEACRAEGLAADDQLWEALKPIARAGQKAGIQDWPGLLEFWRGEAADLARDYREGRAQLAPRDPAKTCLNCDLPALCRIAERGPRLDGDEVSEDVDD